MMKLNMTHKFIFIFLLSGILTAGAQEYTSFDMRWLTNDAKANGITDFHGETEWLDTNQRVQTLELYADFASKFWGDPELNTPMFTDAQVSEKTAKIKPQPVTSIRRSVNISNWHSVGYKKGKEDVQNARWERWTKDGAKISKGYLVLQNCSAAPSIDTVGWRFRINAGLKEVSEGLSVSFTGTKESSLRIQIDGCKEFEIYGDLPARKIYLISGTGNVKEYEINDSFGDAITGFDVKAVNASFDRFSFYDFVRLHEDARMPYRTRLIYDENFNAVPSMEGWQKTGYDDALWETVTLPSPHGSLHAAGENYYLRTTVEVGEFKCAFLDIETPKTSPIIFMLWRSSSASKICLIY